MKYTTEHDEFLRINSSGKTYEEITELFNTYFGLTITKCAMRQHITKTLKLKCVNLHHKFTKEQINWLERHIDDGTYEEVAEAFNKHFGTNLNSQNISDKCSKGLGIHKQSNAGQFAIGRRDAYPIGTERVFNGYVYVKYNDLYFSGTTTMAQFHQNWMQKQRYVYGQTHGSIPDGYIVIFLDGNKTNFDPENLYAVPRKFHAVMCKKRWYTEDRELTLTAIKWCELNNVLKEYL